MSFFSLDPAYIEPGLKTDGVTCYKFSFNVVFRAAEILNDRVCTVMSGM